MYGRSILFIMLSLLFWSVSSQSDIQVFGQTDKSAGSINSPLKQLKEGIPPNQIQCKQGQQLALKSSNFKPVCLNNQSIEILLARGWILLPVPPLQDTNSDENKESTNQTKSYTIELRESMSVGTK